jgi:hypothetical protein
MVIHGEGLDLVLDIICIMQICVVSQQKEVRLYVLCHRDVTGLGVKPLRAC